MAHVIWFPHEQSTYLNLNHTVNTHCSHSLSPSITTLSRCRSMPGVSGKTSLRTSVCQLPVSTLPQPWSTSTSGKCLFHAAPTGPCSTLRKRSAGGSAVGSRLCWAVICYLHLFTYYTKTSYSKFTFNYISHIVLLPSESKKINLKQGNSFVKRNPLWNMKIPAKLISFG